MNQGTMGCVSSNSKEGVGGQGGDGGLKGREETPRPARKERERQPQDASHLFTRKNVEVHLVGARREGPGETLNIPLDPRRHAISELEEMARAMCVQKATWFEEFVIWNEGKRVNSSSRNAVGKQKIEFFLGCSFYARVSLAKRSFFVYELKGEGGSGSFRCWELQWEETARVEVGPGETGRDLKRAVRKALGKGEKENEGEDPAEPMKKNSEGKTDDKVEGSAKKEGAEPSSSFSLFSFDGREISDSSKMAGFDLKPSSRYLTLSAEHCKFSFVSVKTLTGKTIRVEAGDGDLVETLKVRIEEKEGVPPDHQRLVVSLEGKGSVSLEDGCTLSDYIVPRKGEGRDPTVYLVMRLREGPSVGGTQFVDVRGNLEKRAFSSKAPYWRRVGKGLNIHGVCRRSTCNAFGREVIIPKGMDSFDLILQSSECFCPACGGWVEPKTCGFFDCRWTHEAIFREREGERPMMIGGEWQDAFSDAYQKFKKGTESLSYIRLVFFLQDLEERDLCAVCLESLASDGQPNLQTACTPFSCERHKFHLKCISSWLAQGRTCPVCRAPADAR
uniref:RING-type domain-containing protein n=1 Tax=Chromera velia CCMP2878 TaxID=1169474 RepID=A0A0G4HB96_9ALVE